MKAKNPIIHHVDARLLSVLLTSCGASPAYIEDLLISGKATIYLSGHAPTTVFRLGVIQFSFTSDIHQSLLAEMRFAVKETAVQWLLLRYPNGECEVEVLVNGGTAPWHPTELPDRFELLFGKEVE